MGNRSVHLSTKSDSTNGHGINQPYTDSGSRPPDFKPRLDWLQVMVLTVSNAVVVVTFIWLAGTVASVIDTNRVLSTKVAAMSDKLQVAPSEVKQVADEVKALTESINSTVAEVRMDVETLKEVVETNTKLIRDHDRELKHQSEPVAEPTNR